MSRPGRTILAIVVIAIVGIAVLWYLQSLYEKKLGSPAPAPAPAQVPVNAPAEAERAPATAPPATGAEKEAPAKVAEETSEGSERKEPAPGDVLSHQVDGFIAGRKALKKLIETDPRLADATLAEVDGTNPRLLANLATKRFLLGIRAERDTAFQNLGLTVERYREIREAYRKWEKGQPGPAPDLASVFDRRRKEMDEVALGKYELLDY